MTSDFDLKEARPGQRLKSISGSVWEVLEVGTATITMRCVRHHTGEPVRGSPGEFSIQNTGTVKQLRGGWYTNPDWKIVGIDEAPVPNVDLDSWEG